MRPYYLLCLILTAACSGPAPQHDGGSSEIDTMHTENTAPARIFREDSAYKHIEKQVGFGPRVPGTAGHLNCYNYMVSFLKPLADTLYLQNSSARTFDGKTIPVKNIIASFNPNAGRRILLCAHWDTRPFADEDKNNKNTPIPGANDGGSGVGVLLEIASVLKQNPIPVGIDIVLFDAEDWGDHSGKTEDSYCLGSQYWSKNPHVPGYKADFGILLDMVGAPGARFGFEGFSLEQASSYLGMVWSAARSAGYGSYFLDFRRGYVTDDHYYVMKHTGIPVIDIIDYDPDTESHFGKYWHTHNDNMDAIDTKTLKAVGQTLLNVISTY